MYRYFTDLDFRWAMQGGLKMLSIRVDAIESTRIVSPVVDSSCRKSICETRLCKSTLRRNMRIESTRKVPQTNRLSLGVLDMDENVQTKPSLRQNIGRISKKKWGKIAGKSAENKIVINNVPVKSKLQHPPPPQATPRAFEFLENFCSNSPLPRPKSC